MKKIILAMALMLSASPLMAAQQTILGGSGVLWGDEKTKINSNFSELYGRLAQALLTSSSPTFADLTLTSDLNLKDWIYFTSDDDTHYVAVAAGNNTANYILRWPTAAPGGSNYLLNFDADGTGGFTDPASFLTPTGSGASLTVTALGFDGNLSTTDDTLQEVAQKLDDLVAGGDDLGSAAYGDVVSLWTTCSGYLKSDGTCDTPSGSFTYPGAGIPNSTGSAWGTSYTLDTDLSSTSANDDTIPSAKAVKALYDALPVLDADDDVDGKIDKLDLSSAGLVKTSSAGAVSVVVPGTGVEDLLTTPTASNFFTALTGEGGFADDLFGYADAAAVRAGLDLEVGTDFAAYGSNPVTTSSVATDTPIGTGAAAYGGTIYVTSAATITAPAVAVGMNFTVVTIGDIAVSLDVNASDKMILDGVALDDGDEATNTSKAGDTITCQYYSADGWYCWSGTVLGGHWTNGN